MTEFPIEAISFISGISIFNSYVRQLEFILLQNLTNHSNNEFTHELRRLGINQASPRLKF